MTKTSEEEAELGRGRSLAWMVVCYVIAGSVGVAAAWGWTRAGGLEHPLAVALVADVAATLVVFGFSVALDNASMYDPYWSVAPIPIVAWWTLAPGASDAPPVRQALVVGLVTAWGLRLTWNFLSGWSGLRHEDWRYVDLRATTGRWWWPVSLLGVHLMPTALVFAGLIAAWVAVDHGMEPLGWLDAVAAAVTGGAIVVEAAADRQLRRFRSRERAPGEILDEGLWAWSRHPNYLGEVGFWWGLGLFALAAAPGAWWALGGAVSITLLFVVVSIPMIDRRHLARRPHYREHMRRVPGLLPRPPRP
ncbi:MAG: DUF1295 domain-containing protein [Myxococcota bacterium]